MPHAIHHPHSTREEVNGKGIEHKSDTMEGQVALSNYDMRGVLKNHSDEIRRIKTDDMSASDLKPRIPAR